VYGLINTENLDLFCISETWTKSMTDQCLTDAAPAGYSFVSKPRAKKKGGGVAIIHRSGMQIQKLFINKAPHLETVSVKITYLGKSFIVVCLYKAPYFQDDTTLRKIGSFLKKINSLKLPVIITGDLNVHLDDPRDFQTARVNQYLVENFMRQHVSCATHNGGHCLDIIITSRSVEMNNLLVQHQPNNLTDHSVLIWSVTVKRCRSNRVCR